MAIFNKKKKEEEEEIKRKDSRGEKKPKRSRSKKKDNLPKPWEKKDRMLVLYVFVGTIIVSGLLALSARKWKLPNIPKVDFKSFNFFKEEVINLGGSGENVQEKEKIEGIIKTFKKETNKLSGVYGLYVYDLENNFSFGVNSTDSFQAASLMKLPVMIGMYLEEEKEGIDLDDEYVLKNEDKLGGAGSLQYRDEGYEITYRQILKKMGEESDNTGLNICVNYLGEERVEEIIKEIGMTSSSYDENITTPEDVGILFKKLFNKEIISLSNKEEMLDFLTLTSYEKHLAEGVPGDVRVAHKYGSEVHVINDGGIVFADNPYAVVIMSEGIVETEASEIFPVLSEIVFKGMIN